MGTWCCLLETRQAMSKSRILTYAKVLPMPLPLSGTPRAGACGLERNKLLPARMPALLQAHLGAPHAAHS